MILCFSGTGNSRLVAARLSSALGDEIAALPECKALTVSNGRVIWVIPVHSWGVPPVVMQAIESIDIKGDADHYLVATCGDDCGRMPAMWRRAFSRRGWRAKGAWSVTMPNTYVAMRGFDIDSPEVAAAKLKAMPDRVSHIANAIAAGSDATDVIVGSAPWIKTKVIYPWFVKHRITDRPFSVDASACISCGRCANACPVSDITMTDKRPSWQGHCTMCLACYHACPLRAISWGSATHGKGQYRISDYTQ